MVDVEAALKSSPERRHQLVRPELGPERRTGPAVELPKRPVFPVRTGPAVVKVKQEAAQLGDLLKVASITRDEVGGVPHDRLEVLSAERLYPAQRLLAIVTH